MTPPDPIPEITDEEATRYRQDCLYTPPAAFAALPDVGWWLNFGGVEAFPERRAQYEAAGLPFPEAPLDFLARTRGPLGGK